MSVGSIMFGKSLNLISKTIGRISMWRILVALLFVFLVSSCKETKKEAKPILPVEELPIKGGKGLPTSLEELYPKGIEATPKAQKVVEALEEVRIARYKGEQKEVSEEIFEQVRSFINGKNPLDNKVLMLHRLLLADAHIPRELILQVVEEAKSDEELSEPILFSVGVLARLALMEMLSDKEKGQEGENPENIRKLAEDEFSLFERAFKKRPHDGIYAFGLIGAYYDRSIGRKGGKFDLQSFAEEFTLDRVDELINALENTKGMRSLSSPPWLTYEIEWKIVPPAVYGDARIWGPWVTSSDKSLNSVLEILVRKGDFERATKIAMLLRFILSYTPLSIEGMLYTLETAKGYAEVIIRSVTDKELKKKAEIHYDNLKNGTADWQKKAEELKAERHRLIAEGSPAEAMEQEEAFRQIIYGSLVRAFDAMEDILKELYRCQREKEEAQKGTNKQE